MLPMAALVTVAALVVMVQLENCQLVLIIIFASSVYLGNVQAPTQLLVRLVCKLALPAFHGAVSELAGCRLGADNFSKTQDSLLHVPHVLHAHWPPKPSGENRCSHNRLRGEDAKISKP